LIRFPVSTLVLLCAAGVLADDAVALKPADFVGTWQLDVDRSDPTSVMLKALEAPWYARAAMSSFAPTLVIAELGTGISVTTSNPLGAAEKREMPGDGSKHEGVDALGRKFSETTTWQKDGTLLLVRSIDLGNGRSADLEGVWHRSGDDVIIDNVIRKANEAPVKVHRVFRPVAPDAKGSP